MVEPRCLNKDTLFAFAVSGVAGHLEVHQKPGNVGCLGILLTGIVAFVGISLTGTVLPFWHLFDRNEVAGVLEVQLL